MKVKLTDGTMRDISVRGCTVSFNNRIYYLPFDYSKFSVWLIKILLNLFGRLVVEEVQE